MNGSASPRRSKQNEGAEHEHLDHYDTVSQRFLLTSVLKSAGYRDVGMAGSAEEAFARLGIVGAMGGSAGIQTDANLILMDISMPEIDGIDTCRRIKAMEGVQDIIRGVPCEKPIRGICKLGSTPAIVMEHTAHDVSPLHEVGGGVGRGRRETARPARRAP